MVVLWRPRLALAVTLALALTCVGCSPRPAATAEMPAEVLAPQAVKLATPEQAVRSYLDWTSYAYRMGDSDVATPTMSPQEEVRVNSYVQLNAEKGRRIEQRLVSFRPRAQTVSDVRVLLPATELWRYRYVAKDGSRYLSGELTASYETTYALIHRDGSKDWVVDTVDARAVGTVE